MDKSLQETYGPNGICFGCGPANEKGLRIRSFQVGDEFVVRFKTESHHQAFPGVINGGIIGALFDCHGNWAAAKTLFDQNPDKEFPSTVTATFTVNLKRPTPADQELLVKAIITDVRDNVVDVAMEMFVDINGVQKVSSTSTATYVSVPEGHPAHQRWR